MGDSKRTEPSIVGKGEARFSILYRGHRFELRPGTLLIGRGAGCQLILDDALVSRKHAQILVTTGGAEVEDLGSVNGIYLNGERVSGKKPLRDGDRIVIGQQELTVFASTNQSLLPESPTQRLTADTLVGFDTPSLPIKVPESQPSAPPASDDESESTHQGDALELLGGVVDKVLTLGRGDEAERIIGSYLRNYLTTAKKTGSAVPASAEKAVTYAVKLAAATRRGEWVNFAFELYTVMRKPLPGPVVDQLYTVLRQVSDVNLSGLRAYVAVLRSVAPRLGPTERFLAQRIEGLERLASA